MRYLSGEKLTNGILSDWDIVWVIKCPVRKTRVGNCQVGETCVRKCRWENFAWEFVGWEGVEWDNVVSPFFLYEHMKF